MLDYLKHGYTVVVLTKVDDLFKDSQKKSVKLS